MTEATPAPTGSTPRFCRTGALKIAALVIVSAFAGAAASRAAQHWHGHHGHHGPGFMSGEVDPAVMDKRIDHMTGHFARRINATGEQRTKLTEIAKAAANDVLPMRKELTTARKQAREILGQPTVDRAAIEALRAAQVGNLDTMSKRLATALADAAEVLTPEQRKELAEHFPMDGGWRGGWRRD